MENITNKLRKEAAKFTKDEEKAKDIVQDVLLGFIENYPNLDFEQPESMPLLITILKNAFIDTKRKKREIVFSDLEVEDQETGESVTYEPAGGIGDVNYQDVETLIAGLTPKLRDAANLILIKGLSYEATAEALGITLTALHSRIYKIRKQFKLELGD